MSQTPLEIAKDMRDEDLLNLKKKLRELPITNEQKGVIINIALNLAGSESLLQKRIDEAYPDETERVKERENLSRWN